MIERFLATTGYGLARAEYLATREWSVEFLLLNQDVRCLVADPLNPDVVYAGTQGNGILRSSDRGKTWRSCGLSGQMVKALAISPIAPGTVYAGTKPACLFVSRDEGNTWTELTSFRQIRSRRFWLSPAEPPFIGYVQSIALSPVDPKTILVGIEFGAVVRSQDGGQTWTDHQKGALRDCHQLSFHVSNAWKAHSECNALAAIVRSVGGAAWQRLMGGLPQPLNHMPYTLLTDPTVPGHVYAGLSNGEVWHGTDYGDTWHQLPFNLGGIHRTLLLLP